jgi:hypothetical protein
MSAIDAIVRHSYVLSRVRHKREQFLTNRRTFVVQCLIDILVGCVITYAICPDWSYERRVFESHWVDVQLHQLADALQVVLKTLIYFANYFLDRYHVAERQSSRTETKCALK